MATYLDLIKKPVSQVEGINVKMRIIGGITVAIMVWAILPPLSMAAPQVFIYTDKGSYEAGDTIEVSLAGDNYGEGMSVDVYIGLLTPGRSLYTLGELAWSEGIWPWSRDIYLPSQFNMDRTPFFCFAVPCDMPPINQPGQFCFLACLVLPGTFDFASAIGEAPFEVVQVPRDYYVDAELGDDANDGAEDAPWRTITHALGTVTASELSPVTIHVASGTYSASTNGESFPLNMKSFLSLVGEGADVTVLDAEGASTSVICCFGVDDSIIEGFTIAGGDADCGGGIYCQGGSPTIRHNTIAGNSAYDGGGIYCGGDWPTYASATISDNIISDNWGWGSGGGICWSSGYPAINNNRVERNRAGEGGGICCEQTHWGVISGNTIRSNSAGSGGFGGGGVYCCMAFGMEVLGNLITDNSSGAYGAGIFCWHGALSIENNTISGNCAGYSGGGIGDYVSELFITNNRIVGNSSQRGGGICSNYIRTMSNNTIALNIAEFRGGGIWCEYGETLTAFNNTITGNVAGGLGGGIFVWEYSPCCRIVDSIVWNNGGDLYNCDATFCCIEDPDEGQGNIHDDPLFMLGPFGDYYLDPQSPCIDAGSRLAAAAGLSGMTTQIDGTPDAGRVDMGVHYPVPLDSQMRTSLGFQE